jgi:hypothetical protein
MIDRIDEQTKRTQRALDGLSSGRLKIEPLSVHHWRVTNGDQLPYAVQLGEADRWSCTCEDFVARGQTGLRCKHIEAVKLQPQQTPSAPGGQKGINMAELKLTMDEQLKVLNWLVPEWAIKKDKKVAHGRPFVFHEFTRIMLDKVFGPEAWSFTGGSIRPVSLPNGDQLIALAGKMTVRFADGSTAVRSDIGVGLIQSRVASPDLSDQQTDVFETGYKSATTDAIKGCAADLGRCFRPMQDGAMIAAVTNGRFATAFPFPDGLTAELQRSYLMTLAPAWATKTDSAIAGGKPFVPHEYVVQALDTIFGPQHWSFVIGEISVETLPNTEMLVYVPGTLTVTFADGVAATRFDVGLAPIRRKKDASDLAATPTENYETAFKAAVTDALKGCAGDLGCCFRPMLSEEVEAALVKGFFDNEFKRLRPVAPDALEEGKRALGRDDGDLTGASAPQPAATKAIMLFGDGTPVKTTDSIERSAFERFTLTNNAKPASVNALRAWASIYGDGKPVADDTRARDVFKNYVAAHGGVAPANADTLRTWHQQHARQ